MNSDKIVVFNRRLSVFIGGYKFLADSNRAVPHTRWYEPRGSPVLRQLLCCQIGA